MASAKYAELGFKETDFRTMSIDYVLEKGAEHASNTQLFDDLVDLFDRYGYHIDGTSEGPTAEFYGV